MNELFSSAPPQLKGWQADGRQRRVNEADQGNVVEADQRDVSGYVQSMLADSLQCAKRYGVRGDEDCRWALSERQQFCHGCLAALRREIAISHQRFVVLDACGGQRLPVARQP